MSNKHEAIGEMIWYILVVIGYIAYNACAYVGIWMLTVYACGNVHIGSAVVGIVVFIQWRAHDKGRHKTCL